MATKTADQVSAKWLTGISNSQAEMQAGVAAVTVSPGQAAAAKKQKWINALMDPNVQAKWARNVQIGGALQPWQNAMNTYGISRAIQGASQKQSKYTAAMGPLLDYEYALRSQIRAMDDSTPAARDQRMLAWVAGMRKYQRPATA